MSNKIISTNKIFGRRVAMAVSLLMTVGLTSTAAMANADEAPADQETTLTERTTPAFPPIGRQPLPIPDRERPTRIDPSKMETVRKGPAVQFRNFGIKDPSTGQGNEEGARQIPADTLLSLPNGKKIQAGEYYQQLNQFENHITQFGYTLREASVEPTEIQRTKIDLGELQRHTTDAQIKRDPRRVLPRIPVDILKADHDRRIATIPVIKDSIQKWGRGPRGEIKAPKTFNANKVWNGAWGWSDKIGAYVDTSVQVNGTATSTKANANGEAGGFIFGKRLNIIKGGAAVNTPATGAIQGDTAFYFMGVKIFSKNYNGTNPLFFASNWEKGLDVGNTIHFSLGPIPMSAKIGARGQAQLSYRMNILPLHANADITPELTSKVYVQVGVDVVVGGAGAGGELILINNTIPVLARMHLLSDSTGPYYYATLNASDDMTALAGKIYAYVFIYVPAWDVPPWKKKQWDWTIFKHNGIRASGSLYSWNSRLNLY